MSDTANPYQSPAEETQAVEPIVVEGTLTEPMLKYLSGASPWLRFMGIMGFISSGFMALGGISTLAFLPLMTTVFNSFPNQFGEVFGNFFTGSFGPLIVVYALYFLGAAALVFFPALFTYRFGAKIKSYMQTNSTAELELALKNNKSLWKFNGILMIVSMAIIPVFTIVTIIIAVAIALR